MVAKELVSFVPEARTDKFPSPCGVMVAKGFTEAQWVGEFEVFVSVPLRGNGCERFTLDTSKPKSISCFRPLAG